MIKNFDDAHQALREYIPPKQERPYTLDTMRKLMDYLDNPQDQLKVIHVAGTSGKTSTCYYIASMLTASGKTTGLSVSPHIDEINERAQINLVPLPEREFCSKLAEFLGLVQKSGLTPSYFEVLVAFAYWLFEQYSVDYAVVEVGLGGLLDGTNVVSRQDKVCVITDIGLDHTAILGNTLQEIATQKAGIIHAGNVNLMHPQGREVMNAINSVIYQQAGSKLIQVTDLDTALPIYDILPPFQQRNFSLALGVFEYLVQRDSLKPLTAQQLQEATKTYIPARMEICHVKNKTVVLDGSHNQQKLRALTHAIRTAFPTQTKSLLVSFGNNKISRVEEALRELRGISETITFTTFNLGQDEPRTPIDPSLLAVHGKKLGFKNISIERDPRKAFQTAVNNDSEVLIITGSFYLLNHLRRFLTADKQL